MQLRILGKCRFRPSGGFVKPKILLYAPRQPMVALRLDSLPFSRSWTNQTPPVKNPASAPGDICIFLNKYQQ